MASRSRVPLHVLNQLRADRFEWLVPGLLDEKIEALVRSLPKNLRVHFVPVPDVAAAVLERTAPRSAPLLDALERALEQLRGVRVPREAWDLSRLAPHLRMRFQIEDEQGEPIAVGEDLDVLREAVRPHLRAQLSAAAPELERSGLTAWTIGSLPREVALPGSGGAARAFPALVDEGAAAGVRVFDAPAAQAAAMAAGTRRLLLLAMPSTVRYVRDHVDAATQLALAAAPHGSVAAAVEDALAAAVDALVAEAGGPAWDEAAFAALRAHVSGEVAERTATALVEVVRVLAAGRAVRARLDALAVAPPTLAHAREDVERQLTRLLHPGFVTATGVERLGDLERWLRAAARRLERLPEAPGADRSRMEAIHELERACERAGAPAEVRWMIEELRVAEFAQGLGTRGRVSPKRIRQALAAASG